MSVDYELALDKPPIETIYFLYWFIYYLIIEKSNHGIIPILSRHKYQLSRTSRSCGCGCGGGGGGGEVLSIASKSDLSHTAKHALHTQHHILLL